jgi:uncharacterized protein involved in exopolysaccharide biosynthesis/Mrp family chromosome partitioning ATPase
MSRLLTGTIAEPVAPEVENRPTIFHQLWQKRGVVAVTFGATFLFMMVLLFILPTSYLATGSVIVADREPLVGSNSPAWVQKIGDPADMESTILLIRSPRLLRVLLSQPGMSDAVLADCQIVARQLASRLRPPDCGKLEDDPEAQILWMLDRVGVGEVGRSRVISISYKSPQPQVAQALANGLIRTFLDDEHGKMMRTRDEAIDWVKSRLTQLDAELRHDEQAIEDFRNSHGLVRGVSGLLAAERLTSAAEQLSEAKSAEADAALRLQESAGGASSRQALESRSISDLKQQLSVARAAAASAAQRLGPKNPDLIAARRQEQELSAALALEVRLIVDSARRNMEAARNRVAAAQLELAQRTEAANQAAEAETQTAAMTRELEIKRDSFVDLSRRMSQLETERRIIEPSTQLVNLAELPTRPAFPQKLPFLVGGLTLAAILGTAAGLITYKPEQGGTLALNRGYTRVPILAQIPELRVRRNGSKKELVARKREFPIATAIGLLDSHPPLLEAMRILHARLTLVGFGTRRRTLMVTSETANEGKSFVTLALARLARASGRRVLVIEATLRQPFLEEGLNGPPSPGLGGYLVGGTIDIVQLSGVPGVDFLLAGDPLNTSTELLSGPRFLELLEWAKNYDLVLIDSPAVATLMDAALLAPHVDGILFCLRTGRPPTVNALNSLPEMQREYGNVVGLALTFVPDDRVPVPQIALVPKAQLARAMQPGDA